MWQRNSIGPSTVPWGNPESTVVSFDFSPSTIVRIDLAVRKFVNHLWILPFIPYWCNLWRSLLCGTVSKAFEKSNIATSNWCPLSIYYVNNIQITWKTIYLSVFCRTNSSSTDQSRAEGNNTECVGKKRFNGSVTHGLRNEHVLRSHPFLDKVRFFFLWLSVIHYCC